LFQEDDLSFGKSARIKFDERYCSGYAPNMKTAMSLPDNLFRKADALTLITEIL